MVTIQEKFNQSELSFKDLIAQLKEIKQTSFSGNLIIQVESVPSWMLSFVSGKLSCISGGIDPINRWQRNLAIACLDLPLDRLVRTDSNEEVFLNSNLLAQQWAGLEVLFDIIQYSQFNHNRLFYQLISTNNHILQSNLSLPLLEIEPILSKAIISWQEWIAAGLNSYFPGQFAYLHPSEQISQLIAAANSPEVLEAIDGNRSLRALAISRHQHILTFTQSLLPLLKAGAIALSPHPRHSSVKVESSSADHQLQQHSLISGGNLDRRQPLVACVDDSPIVYQNLEKILTEHGYRSFGVQDPLKILPTLIKNKPDIIFLDLIMPITSGYEVCEQIRKTPSLKDIPVVILTGKDGLVDRVRAKFVGANGFLGKPVRQFSVLKMIDKHLKIRV